MVTPPRNRIVVRLLDGLGNQLFQYALGRRLAIDRQADLYFDAAVFSPGVVVRQPRRLAIPDFDIKGEITRDSRWSEAWLRRGLMGRAGWHLEQSIAPLSWRRFIQEDADDYKKKRTTFNRQVLNVRNNTYLHGWWVSPRYFESIEDTLRSELVLGRSSQDVIRPWLQQIEACEAVSIHVRRGDFLKHVDFGVLGPEYYTQALRLIRERTANPRFFVFSDDVPEARNLLNEAGLERFECIELPAGTSPACDMWLMASCKHFINANSTFSWWGAWLARNQDKIVVVPECWYVGARIKVADVYPDDWIGIAT